MYACTLMSAKYLGLHGTLTWHFNIAQLRKCIDEWCNCVSKGLQYKPTIVQVYIMWINELMLSIIKHHIITSHWCISLIDARSPIDNDDGIQGTRIQTEKCE